MILAIGIPYPEFLSFGSIKTVLRQSALIGIIAFGMVFLAAMVEIDLSVGGIFATASSLAALLIKIHHLDPWIAVTVALLAGIILGGFNGILSSLLKVPLIIVSLGNLVGVFRSAPNPVGRESGLRPTERPRILHAIRRRSA